MSQVTFHYKITDSDEVQTENLEDVEFIRGVRKLVSIESEDGIRSTVVITTKSSDDFERLNSLLEDTYENVWFDY